MIIKRIYIQHDSEYDSLDQHYSFFLKTRSMCNYIQRKLKEKKFKSDEYNSIIICLSPSKEKKYFINSSETLIIYHYCDKLTEYYDNMNNLDSKNFYKRILELIKYEIYESDYLKKELANFIVETSNEFVSDDCINEWIIGRKNIKIDDILVKISLLCKLDINKFYLYFIIEDKDKNIEIKELIVDSSTDEMQFYHIINKISISFKNNIVEIRNIDMLLYSFDLFRKKENFKIKNVGCIFPDLSEFEKYKV